jgi:hypothetical protein
LAPVVSVHIGFVVVDADAAVGIVRVDSDLDGGGEDVRGGDVEIEDGGVLKDEMRFVRLENRPNEEDDKEYEEEEDEECCAKSLDEPLTLAFVVAALFDVFRHFFEL